MRKALLAGLALWLPVYFALGVLLAHGQPLTNLGFTLHGEPGPGWMETPLGVVHIDQYIMWRLTLRGVVPVAEVLRERMPHA